ncbi:nucleotidyltransferase family protein [Frigidibacter sp. ROC022]|uniref:nucleotidyltransferase family protein n=1 Tax=Frigidibacter sp. ROC022 TaxID=2971796 RepID=UPI00215A7E1D|nr:nucleotidyltransferase family protein [Frigidibacter sp. ROC022]MCR8724490.1 nucleotidyltransferase family protein [Frigidibacter sp. ROC022]
MRNGSPALMLFAAGLGRRMAPLTDTRPKPLIPVAGRPLIDHALALARDVGIGRVVVNTHYLAEMLAAHLADSGATLIHEPVLLETGGGLRNAVPLLGDGPVLTLNSDALWQGKNPLQSLISAWEPARMEALLLLCPKDRAVGHPGKGDFSIDAEGRLSRGGDLIYTGAQMTRTDRLSSVPDAAFSLNRVWDMMMESGSLYGTLHPGRWSDVGRPEGIALAEAMLEAADV